MLTVNPNVGIPIWLSHPSEDDLEAMVVFEDYRKHAFLMKECDIHETIEFLKDYGNKLFGKKRFREAGKMYEFAFILTCQINICFEEKSKLKSNLALSWLKLDCPLPCIKAAKEAIGFSSHNVKAHHHLAAAHYMIYEFEEALQNISVGLKVNPECHELLMLKKKILFNKVSDKFTKNDLLQRLRTYKFGPWTLQPVIIKLENELIYYDQISNGRIFLEKAKVVEANKILAINELMKVKEFDVAFNELVNLHHIYHVKEEKYHHKVTNEELYNVYYNKTCCLYYLENYQEALKSCAEAKSLKGPSANLLILEARILIKCKRFDEAEKILENRSVFVRAGRIKAFVVEELAFVVNLQIGKMMNPVENLGTYLVGRLKDFLVAKVQGMNTQPENKIEAKTKSENNKDDKKSKQAFQEVTVSRIDESNINKIKCAGRRCDTCLVYVESSWTIHVQGKKHRALVDEMEKTKIQSGIQGVIDSVSLVSSRETMADSQVNADGVSSRSLEEDQIKQMHDKENEDKSMEINFNGEIMENHQDNATGDSVSEYGSCLSHYSEQCTDEFLSSKGTSKGSIEDNLQPVRDITVKNPIGQWTLGDAKKVQAMKINKRKKRKRGGKPKHFKCKEEEIKCFVSKEKEAKQSDESSLEESSDCCLSQASSQMPLNEVEDCLVTDETANNAWKQVVKNKCTNDAEIKDNVLVTFAANEKFPLPLEKFNVSIICSNCEKKPGKCLNCLENLLAVQNRQNGEWIVIRERNDHGHFYGRYRICANRSPCFRGHICSFAHSKEEAIIWNSEKQKEFSIRKFLHAHRSKSAPELGGIESIFKAFPGFILLACGECYSKNKCLIGRSEDALYCSIKSEKHNWSKSKMMIHNSEQNDSLTPIGVYSGMKKLEICSNKMYCSKRYGLCSRPHSLLEKEVWTFLERSKCTQLDFLSKFNDLYNNVELQEKVPSYVAPNPPHSVTKICSICWTKEVASCEDPKTGNCNIGHKWVYDCLFYIPKARMILKHLPKIIPHNHIFKMCWNVENRKPCKLDNCQFGHSKEELEIWTWMLKNGVSDPGLVAKKCESREPGQAALLGENVAVRNKKAWGNLPRVDAIKIEKEEIHYCPYCEKKFGSKKEIEEHKNSLKHMEQIESDNCVQWNYRIPPYESKYELCKSHQERRCYYSDVPDECNYCTHAHSQEELDEWNGRKRWKTLKRNDADRNHFLSTASRLRKKYEEAEFKTDVMVDHVEGVQLFISDDLIFRSTNKNCEHIWTFEIHSEQQLKEVYLLEEHGQRSFSLVDNPGGKEHQCMLGAVLIFQNCSNACRVLVKFRCTMFGFYSQRVIFDFGTYPVIFKTIKCQVSLLATMEKLEIIRLNLNLNRWTTKNAKIVGYPNVRNKHMPKILLKYTTKDIDEIMFNNSIMAPLTKDTYRRKMHDLLYLEELAQTDIISKYNLKTNIELDNKAESSAGGLQICKNGELYGKISLENLIIEGSLMLKSVRGVLFRPLKTKCANIYEAPISEFEDKNMKSITGEIVTILLHERCCEELNLKAGDKLEAEVQFQLDRNSFCKMHYAIDNITHMGHLYPEMRNVEAMPPNIPKLPELNARQNEVISYIFRQGGGYLPPLVVYGPFGTGKTEAIAKASLLLAKEKKDSKILICTKSNLTADEYFKRYFCVKPNSEQKIIRIYSEDRRIDTVDRDIQKFCLFDKVEQKFCLPSAKDILDSQIIVTTLETSFYLKFLDTKLGISHIFIDEAGQDLECRTIIPFTLAEENTCIVLAGDHMQMGEEIHNQDAKEQNFEQSLLERLFHYYALLKGFGKTPKIFLNENYRNHKSILSFISQIYYGKEDAIIPKQIECQSNFKPLEFFAVYGNEVVNRESASIYNLAEVDEVVERVSYTYENWPEEWGRRDASQILVTSPYMDQIRFIRMALRNKSRSLSGIVVIRVQNVPGLEFRAVFISSVRTSARSLSQQLECGSNDEGFLSQPKLLNSALSRAKSYLAVIGDPVALCSIGQCSKIWIEFFKKCQELQSINPSDLTVEDIKMKCNAKEFGTDISEDIEDNLEESESYDEIGWEEGFQLKPDEIIKQLVLEYSNDEECGFTVTLQETEQYQQKAIKPNFNPMTISAEPVFGEATGTYRCRLLVNGVNKFAARPLDSSDFEIVIPSRRHCKTALDQDEVSVKIINYREDNTVYGKVIKVLKRKIDITNRQIVCFIEENNSDIMVPINKKLPKIKIVVSNRAKETKRCVSIYKLLDDKLHFVRDIAVNLNDQHSRLYLVKILKWEEEFHLPLGVVFKTIKAGSAMEDTMRILDYEYNIPERLESNAFFQSYKSSGLDIREDQTDVLVFTIDGEETTDIDDAIGFQILDSKDILLSIHISDVSFYIDANSALDEKAKKRATSFYPPNRKPSHMLPEQCGTDICSLKEGVDRRALSIFMTLDGEGNLNEENIVIKRTLIRSKHRLTYEDVELVLMDDIQALGRYPPELIVALKNINKITINWRKERLGSDALEWKTDIFCMDGPNSRALIEELMITANKIIAQFLLEKLPHCTPLRIQTPPNESELNVWRNEFSSMVSMTNGMRRYFKTFPEVCRCNGFCSCIEPASICDIEIPKDVWREILNAFETQKSMTLGSLVNDLNKLPQATIACNFLQKLQDKAEYICSGVAPNGCKSHFSLNSQAYTHFTSPIRRYIDLVVHRLVINCIENQPPSYSQDEITEICQHCTYISGVSREYDKASLNALMCNFLKERPLKIDATITKISEKFEIELHSMRWHKVFGSQLVLKPSNLRLEKQPEILSDSTLLFWKLRVYMNSIVEMQNCPAEITISSNRLINKVSPDKWSSLVDHVKNVIYSNHNINPCDLENLITAAPQENLVELSSEGGVSRNSSHFCKCTMKLKPVNLMTIQISSKLHRGLLTPFVQMVPLTKMVRICTEHNADPIKCFADMTNKMASKRTYASLREYKRLWKPVLNLESVHSAVVSGVPAIIHSILFQWDNENQEITGQFYLEKEFCAKRHIFYSAQENQDWQESSLSICSTEGSYSYICVQYHDVMLETDGNTNKKIQRALGDRHPVDIILHCIITCSTHVRNTNLIQFSCIVKQHSLKCLDKVLQSISTSKTLATIEWIEQTLPSRRMMKSLEQLDDSLKLASKIALMREVPRPSLENSIHWSEQVELARPNSTQERAITMSMNSSFSLIQGPPGTGKTFVMAHLVSQFDKANKNTDHRVMCCGPSNKSADVIASSLLKLNPQMKLLRICGEAKENKCYPLPYFTSFVKEKAALSDEKTDENLKDHTLHHIIRNEQECRYARELLNLEAELAVINQEEKLIKYKNLKRKAENMIISRASVIITTCTGCGAGKLLKVHIKQLLIDECAMCTEPESMVPIVFTRAQQVVLIGDHKQLRPIVTNKQAEKLGLNISLFQRYSDTAFMLTKQYRMHEAIAEFPSIQFYDGKLTVGNDCQRDPSTFDFWPGGRHMPIAFVNAKGSEESLTTSSEEGGLESKKNVTQVTLAVKIAFNLVHHYKVKGKEIIILSQYRAQCTEITKLLRTKNLSSVSVSTVISAQGSERKYVILSTVRSLPSHEIERNPGRPWRTRHLGFVADPHQINVALTRAEKGLIILGNKDLLGIDTMWRDLLDHYNARGALVEIENFSLLQRFPS